MVFTSSALVIAAAIQWGLAGGLGSLLMSRGWAPELISFWRALIGLGCMTIWLAVIRLQGKRLDFNRHLLFWSVVAGLGVAGNFTFYFISISEGSVAVAATLMYSAPVFVYLASFLVGAERPTLVKLFAIALVMSGIVLLTGIYRAEAGVITTLGIISGLLSGLSYALFIFAFKYAGAYGPAPSALSIAFATGTLVLVALINHEQALTVPVSADAFWFVLLGLLGAGLSFYCYIVGLRGTLPTTASIVAMVEPVTAALFGLVILGELLNLTQVVGMVLILGAVTGLSILQSRSSPSEASDR
ncbi:DMT family transporter [Modicisalibacter xianhensis]|uniref:Threonine/homoserine efflux transporter RhtA n=1 Tax=Modicisalibacter xianhensis TaxID=442341 RepID=A0A1I3CUN1_9GAMM|nr:DMT family transporter [Halomonas xianhensis]SFH77959.1 Threonine/homoserine efflux transporter RhtA [Halomonas xianhensis]